MLNNKKKKSKLDYTRKIIEIIPINKVIKGGKRLKFRVSVIVGYKNQKVGLGVSSSKDISIALEKATLNAKKKLQLINITSNFSIPYIINYSLGTTKIRLCPASLGTGIIAGSSIRTVLELAGYKNIIAKQFGSNNILNNAKSTLKALFIINEKNNILIK